MIRYQPSTPRVALGFVAATMTALTIGLAGILPAGVYTAESDTGAVVATQATVPEASARVVAERG